MRLPRGEKPLNLANPEVWELAPRHPWQGYAWRLRGHGFCTACRGAAAP